MNELTLPPSETLKQPEVKLEPELSPQRLAKWGMTLLPDEFKARVYGQYEVESHEYQLAQIALESIVGMLVYDMLRHSVTTEQEKAEWTSKIEQQQLDQEIQSSLLEQLESKLQGPATPADSSQVNS